MINNIDHYAKLFEIVGEDKEKEAAKWIKEFSKVDRSRFGVIKVSGASLEKYISDFSEGVSILASLGLYTPIVYGWGELLTERLAESGIESRFHPETKDRITTPDMIYCVRATALELGLDLVDAIKERQMRARLCRHVFDAETKEWGDVSCKHYTGDIKGVDVRYIKEMILQGIVPIVPPLGWSGDCKILNINGDTAANGLVRELKPLKYIMITNTGGILDKDNKIIPRIILDEDYDRLISSGTISGGMRKKLDEVKSILEMLTSNGYNPSVQISHPSRIVIELFTDTGMGTYITKSR